jgi:DNA-binding transcriptional LysR family regulator
MLDPVTLDQLRVLVAVSETGSFSAAARKLGRVQSAISQAVQALEAGLGTTLFERDGKVPKLNDAGRVILADARRLITGMETLKARAESITRDVEPELSLAVDAIIPIEVLTRSLKGLSEAFPCLPVTLFTEGLGGAEQRLRDGVARLGLYVPIPGATEDMEAEFLMPIPTVPVVATDHPLAAVEGPLSREMLEGEVQLVLTDRTPITNGLAGGILSRRTWRFADLSTRLDFLLAGFGWCNMPTPMVSRHIDAGRLKVLDIPGNPIREFPIHVVYQRGRPPGRAGRWLIDEIRRLLPDCEGHMSAYEPGKVPEAAE